MNDRANPIIVETKINQPVSKVWLAITDVSQMRQWFFDNIPDFKPEVGFSTNFVVKSEERTFTHDWKILAVIPQKLITYHWSYEEFEGVGYVTFELITEGGSTIIRLTNKGLDSFPDNLPEFTHDSCLNGWQYFIQDRLCNYLES